MSGKSGGWDAWSSPENWQDEPSAGDEQPPVEQLLIHLGREVQKTNEHLAQLRLYTGVIVLLAAAGVLLVALWLFGVITIEIKPL